MTARHGRWALVTGATGGLGRAFCAGLAQRGYNLLLTARNKDALAALEGELSSTFHIEVASEAFELGEVGAGARLHAAIKQRGIAIDTLINNAGFGIHGRFIKQPTEREAAMIDVNVRALTELTHVFAKDMAERGGGRILLVASTAAYQPIPGYAVYAATKSYVLSLGYALHEELRRKKVVVTVLCPGPTETHFWSRAKHRLNPTTARMLMQPGPVAEIGLTALDRGRHNVVAGPFNKMIAFVSRLLPRAVLAKGAEAFMSRASGDPAD
ncbi:SDR family oxidoreductase [Ciceribacter sp. L1K22]|uniref:SDR family NAD(P)-dependent oxidoreductase n=1 Tax=Ciceribacter sp. L1K22 TaxID=2820275 RepID=UPI001ABE2E06|nr:SDR family oxidoreductase [Ciceribacter sp. L1K22]MBO3759735.1 SDR family oxidoreductase [Ciceribacter sp. L1K22]